MFSVDEIDEIRKKPQFSEDYKWVSQSLVSSRYKKDILFDENAVDRLTYFVESVLTSSTEWSEENGKQNCKVAGEIAELLSSSRYLSNEKSERLNFRSALLYELAGLPAISSTYLNNDNYPSILKNFFNRDDVFGKLNGYEPDTSSDDSLEDPFSYAVNVDLKRIASYSQGLEEVPQEYYIESIHQLSKFFDFDLTSSELGAIKHIFKRRLNYTTRSNVDDGLFQTLKKIHFPVELWPTQKNAIDAGLVDRSYDSWGFAAPTGTGKTYLSRLLMLSHLKATEDSKILYIVPSRALVHEVASGLNDFLDELDYKAVEITPELVELDEEQNKEIQESSIAVLTPEKADLLLRLDNEFINKVSLIVVDEAHHIESKTRGALLELYLWRIKKLFGNSARVVFLSAVTPNISDLAGWMGTKTKGYLDNNRSTRMRVGTYDIKKIKNRNTGWINYSDGTSLQIVDPLVEQSKRGKLVQLANAISDAGPVLTVAKGKGTCEILAQKLYDWQMENNFITKLTEDEYNSVIIQRLDSRLEREMYSDVKMRELLKYGIVYHHAGLPPNVRRSVEDAIKEGLIDYVFSTTTLAEGVNFPFSSVIVQSIAFREPPQKGKPASYHPVTPRNFWNIAGRAGRPGSDREGQVILFSPSLGLDKVDAVLESYLDPSIENIPPVKSGLSDGIINLLNELRSDKLNTEDLNHTSLPESLSRQSKGTVNLLRVGLIHANTSDLIESPEEIIEGSFARKNLSKDELSAIVNIIKGQSKVISDFFKDPNSPSMDMLSEIGLSLETVSELRDYVKSLDDWQLEGFGSLTFRGQIDFSRIIYLISPVAKRMAELEGSKLGAIYADIIVKWLSGVPLKAVSMSSSILNNVEKLISVIYSRVQYLLPWGLYTMHRLVEEEMERREISGYNGEILSVAYLVDAGVPNFEALRLASLNFERVDATRLSNDFHDKDLEDKTDIISWLTNQDIGYIKDVLRGIDNRRIDYDLEKNLKEIGFQF